MACHYPLRVWHSKEVNKTGRRPLVFRIEEALETDKDFQIGCGRCAGCRLERSRQWAMRITNEAQMHSENCFITLTFDDVHLDKRKPVDINGNRLSNWSIWPREFQLFMKRLRKRYPGKKIRYFHCGEYGDHPEVNQNLGRPHYHAIIFNHNFADKIEFGSSGEHKYYISRELRELWPFGNNIIGEVAFDSAAYVARYAMKKRNGPATEGWYTRTLGVNPSTAEIFSEPLHPEYVTMSKKPGIGAAWFKKYQETDLYNKDYVMINGKKCRAPKYYDRLLEETDPEKYEEIKEKRSEEMENLEELDINRLMVLEESQEVKLNRKRRAV